MNYIEFESRVDNLFDKSLPGQESHFKMAPVNRKGLDLNEVDLLKVKRAAVAALFYEVNQLPHLVLTLRNKYPGVHSGQISFPGGKIEEEDLNFKDTALRETFEEIGIARTQISIHCELSPLYIPPSNFLVQPFLGSMKGIPQFVAEEKEVQEILSIDFNQFFEPRNIQEKRIKIGESYIEVPAYYINGHTIWGATAMMISELKDLLSK